MRRSLLLVSVVFLLLAMPCGTQARATEAASPPYPVISPTRSTLTGYRGRCVWRITHFPRISNSPHTGFVSLSPSQRGHIRGYQMLCAGNAIPQPFFT